MLDEAIGDDEKLKDALDQVEQVTKSLEEERQRHRKRLVLGSMCEWGQKVERNGRTESSEVR